MVWKELDSETQGMIIVGITFLIFLTIAGSVNKYLYNQEFGDCYNADDKIKDMFWQNDTCYDGALQPNRRYECQIYNRTAHKEFCKENYGGAWE